MSIRPAIGLCLVIGCSVVFCSEDSSGHNSLNVPVYQRAFCQGTDFDGTPIKMPCIDIRVDKSSRPLTFLFDTNRLYSSIDPEVISELSAPDPVSKTVLVDSTSVPFDFYSLVSLHLGNSSTINTTASVILQHTGRYKEAFGVSGILGIQHIDQLVWELDIENSELRVYDHFSADILDYPVQSPLSGGLPRVQITTASITTVANLSLLESEDILLGKPIAVLIDSESVVLVSNNILRRVDLVSVQVGQNYNFTDKVQHLGIYRENAGVYYFPNNLGMYSGFANLAVIGQGFLRKQKRIVLDLRQQRKLYISPATEE